VELLLEAESTYRELGQPSQEAKVAGPLGLALGRLGRAEEAVERTKAALEVVADEPPDEEIGQLYFVVGRGLFLLGRYDEGVLPMERALAIAEALQLPELLAQGLNGKATMYVNTARVEEARLLLAGAAEIARRHGRIIQLSRAQGNLGNVGMEWDLPDAADQLQSALELSLRQGDRYGTYIATGNLMVVHLFRGRWEEAERLAAETLQMTEDGEIQDVHHRLVLLHTLRGEISAARASFAHLAAWEQSDEREARALHRSARLSVQLAEGDLESAVTQGRELMEWILEHLAASNENARFVWPATLQAALALGRLDAARELVELLSGRPPGHIPPYLNAQLRRGRALLAAAEGRHDEVEAMLEGVASRMREFGYPYWLAVTQTDLAEWLLGQDRREEAEPLLEEAIATLRGLGAAPALARAESLAGGALSDPLAAPSRSTA
jgi:tetratricopeptide (TPR) repeat protein